MKTINVPSACQPVRCIGFSKDFSSTDNIPSTIFGYIRVKNVSDDIGHIRLKDVHSSSEDDGMAFSAGETEYVYINEGEQIEIVDGEFNIMW